MFFACSTVSELSPVDYNEPLVLRTNDSSLDLNQLSFAMSDFFHCGKDDFGLATLCGCDCTSLNMIPNIWNSCGDNMTNLFEISSFEDYSCSDFLNSIRTTCSGRTIDEIQIEATELLSQFGNANPDEILLINQIIDDVQNNLEVSALSLIHI